MEAFNSERLVVNCVDLREYIQIVGRKYIWLMQGWVVVNILYFMNRYASAEGNVCKNICSFRSTKGLIKSSTPVITKIYMFDTIGFDQIESFVM